MKRFLLIAAVLLAMLLIAAWAKTANAPEAPAPVVDEYAGWSTGAFEDLSFRYPERLGSYVSLAEVPTLAQASSTCAGELRTVHGKGYCVLTESEGAAGSTYVSYAYAADGLEVSFTLRYPQCMNYDEPSQSACTLEQQTVDVDALADRILSSVH